MSDSISRAIAAYAVHTWPAHDEGARREARRRLLDSIGVAFAGFDHPGPRAALRYAKRLATDRGCVLWGTSLRAPAEVAGFFNGALIRCLDFNDAYFGRDSTHPSDMIGALVAVAEERGSTGAQLLDAIAVGYEVAADCADAFGVRANGWDHVNITSVGACAAVARLIGLTADQAEQAIALTVVPNGAMLQTRAGNLSMWKGMAAPHGARLAVTACHLAEAGVEGPYEPFEGKRGFVALLLDGVVPVPAALDRLRDLEPPTRIGDTHLKAWPLGYVSQSAVAATLEARAKIPQGVTIEHIRVSTYGVAVELMGSPEKYRPGNRATADHSLPYVVVAALDDGAITEETFAQDRIVAPATHERLRRVVEVVEDPALTAAYPGSHSARVELVATSGETFAAQVDHPPGHAANPLSDEALTAKFIHGAQPILGSRVEAVHAAVDALEHAGDVTSLTALLQEVAP